MRLPRMTTRRWMIAVAAVALMSSGAVAGLRIRRRHVEFLARVQSHTQMERFCALSEHQQRAYIKTWADSTMLLLRMQERFGLDSGIGKEDARNELESFRRKVANWRRWTSYHTAMARKYRHAARYPWLPVEPDPPPPER